MRLALRLLEGANRLLSLAAAMMFLVLLGYGGYCMWDNRRIRTGARVSERLLEAKPVVGEGEASPSFAGLKQINPDVIGWLTIEDTQIDYPVLQGEDDMEYINKNAEGVFSLSGALFLSAMNAPDFSEPYQLIYGHHMDGGEMFGDLSGYLEEDFFESHPRGTLCLENRVFPLECFACVKADAYDRRFYPVRVPKDQAALLSAIEEEAVCFSMERSGTEEPILGLTTCLDAETNGRVIVFYRLLSEN